MCQYSTYVTLAVCADVQRTGDPSTCKRQTVVSAARATALASPLEVSALDRHLDLICGAIDARREATEPPVVVAAAPMLGGTGGCQGPKSVPGGRGPRALARVRELAKAAVGRISEFFISPYLTPTSTFGSFFTSHTHLTHTLLTPSTASSLSLPRHFPPAATHPLRLLPHATDSTTLLHRHFERARIEKLGPSPSSRSSASEQDAERKEEVEGRIWTWLETGAFW